MSFAIRSSVRRVLNGARETAALFFLDLGFPPEEAAILEVKAALVSMIESEARSRGLSDQALAEVLGIQEQEVKSMFESDFSAVQLEQFVKYIDRLGLRIKTKAASRRKRIDEPRH